MAMCCRHTVAICNTCGIGIAKCRLKTNNPVLEKDIEKSVGAWAERRGWFHRKFKSPGRRSAPDRIFALNGYVLFIEFKAKGKTPTVLQAKEHDEMRAAGLRVYWTDNVADAKDILMDAEFDMALAA